MKVLGRGGGDEGEDVGMWGTRVQLLGCEGGGECLLV